MQSTRRLACARVHRHTAFKVIITDFYELDTQVTIGTMCTALIE